MTPLKAFRGVRRAVRRKPRSLSRGITLVELCVVVALLGVLISLLLPALTAAREQQRSVECRNRLKQFGLAIHNYEGHWNRLPPCWIGPLNDSQLPTSTTFHFRLLPYMGQSPLYRQANDRTYLQTATVVVSEFLCASSPHKTLDDNPGAWAVGNHVANFQIFGDPERGDTTANMICRGGLESVTDGTSTTVAMAERYGRCGVSRLPNPPTPYGSLWGHGNMRVYYQALFAYGDSHGRLGFVAQGDGPGSPWGPMLGKVGPHSLFQIQPRSFPQSGCDYAVAQTYHQAMPVLLVDGSVRTLGRNMDGAVWWALLTPHGGESIEGF